MNRRTVSSATSYVGDVCALTPSSTLVRLIGPRLFGYEWNPGDWIRIRISGVATLRTYSVWDADADAGWLEIVLFDHGTPDSVGLEWARHLEAGTRVSFLRGSSRGFPVDQNASQHLFVGDETAAAGFGAMLRALPKEATVQGVIEANTPEDQIELPRELLRIERDGGSASPSQNLVDAVTSLDFAGGAGTAYIAGEARTVQLIRTHLVRERGWDRRAVHTKPFWTPGKRGLH